MSLEARFRLPAAGPRQWLFTLAAMSAVHLRESEASGLEPADVRSEDTL
ncbi:hypothetical protein [Amycolatopsis coloradensis]|nr:hypothetical protein [Amycolatopsis coloradensis]